MSKYILIVVFCSFFISHCYSQDEYRISFSYDSAGNQTLRDRVCINCNSGKSEVDSIAIAVVDDKLDQAEEEESETGSTIIAYPNPVTDILQVEWVSNDKKVQQVSLFSSLGRQLQSKKIRKTSNSINLSFSSYPPGSYFVIVRYSDKSKQSFQVIKTN